jgi:hypothetical protein
MSAICYLSSSDDEPDEEVAVTSTNDDNVLKAATYSGPRNNQPIRELPTGKNIVDDASEPKVADGTKKPDDAREGHADDVAKVQSIETTPNPSTDVEDLRVTGSELNGSGAGSHDVNQKKQDVIVGPQYRPGTVGRLVGLIKAPTMNGKLYQICERDPKLPAATYGSRLPMMPYHRSEGGEIILIRPVNFQLLSDAELISVMRGEPLSRVKTPHTITSDNDSRNATPKTVNRSVPMNDDTKSNFKREQPMNHLESHDVSPSASTVHSSKRRQQQGPLHEPYTSSKRHQYAKHQPQVSTISTTTPEHIPNRAIPAHILAHLYLADFQVKKNCID